MIALLDKLYAEQCIDAQSLRTLLGSFTDKDLHYAQCLGQKVAQKRFGNRIFVRGLIEIGNCCANDCYYCGIRMSNRQLQRYRLQKDDILLAAAQGYAIGFRTFVLQGGEDPWLNDDRVVDIVASLRYTYPDVAITLSLGERSTRSYERFYEAGANRYLLRHETINEEHYQKLHPQTMSLSNRRRCLMDLKKIGFQTGSGIMVGSPYQTIDHIVEDILFLQELQPQMIGLGPFLPHHATPFATYPPGDLRLTLMLLCILRMMHPKALIPATTALASLHPQGREEGIKCGCNVVMPNLSPPTHRKDYALYDNKAALGAEAAEGLHLLGKQLDRIGYEIDFSRGDYS